MCFENKGADQLRGYREADLRLCFHICKKPVFSRRGSNGNYDLFILYECYFKLLIEEQMLDLTHVHVCQMLLIAIFIHNKSDSPGVIVKG